MSWYRTYRPQRIADLDITPVRDAFSRILSLGEFDHAYLLTGPKGTGKTSAARILAKVLNCAENKKVIEQRLQTTVHSGQKMEGKKLKEPCNVCASCIAITNGSSLSVTEIDAASNRGIDDIRALRERIGLSPADGLISVYIIDEVHMLTTESFNALLKILEEPPKHVVFILATTDPQKMPTTVISRCTRIPYRKANPDEIIQKLTRILEIEKITVDPASLQRIATAGDGSFRDSVKMLEQIAKGRNTVTMTDVDVVIGEGTGRLTADLLTALLGQQSDAILSIFQNIADSGMDGVAFQKEVLTMAHAKLVEFASAKDPRSIKLIRLLKAIAIPIEPLVPIPWLPFEIACLEYAEEGRGQMATGNGGTRASEKGKEEKTVKTPLVVTVREKEDTKATERPIDTEEEMVSSVDLATVQGKWTAVLAEVRSQSTPMDGILKATKLIGLDGITVQIQAAYQFHKEQLEVARNSIILEDAMKRVFGTRLKVRVLLAPVAESVLRSHDSNISGRVDDTALVKAAEDAFL